MQTVKGFHLWGIEERDFNQDKKTNYIQAVLSVYHGVFCLYAILHADSPDTTRTLPLYHAIV